MPSVLLKKVCNPLVTQPGGAGELGAFLTPQMGAWWQAGLAWSLPKATSV